MVVVSIVLKLVVVQPAPWSWSKSVVVNPAKTQKDAESRSRLDGIVPGLRNIVLEDGGLSGALIVAGNSKFHQPVGTASDVFTDKLDKLP